MKMNTQLATEPTQEELDALTRDALVACMRLLTAVAHVQGVNPDSLIDSHKQLHQFLNPLMRMSVMAPTAEGE